MLEVGEDCDMTENNQQLLRKVAEEQDLNTGKIIYFDIISQKKPRYGGSNNWIIIQDLDTTEKWSFFIKAK